MILFIGGVFVGTMFGLVLTAILSVEKYEDILMEREINS
ncbi:hypothetical protein EB16_02746 [Enterococcus faecium]|nr:hypothetical protein A5827_002503 [Enterococcus faecium]OTO71541.1 hypothetical protein A5840_002642 [Enterococcus faecium]OTO82156.1 hypothetical protein A5855_002622 [Enterococcus faecium]RBS36336.1 hypothetical protein EB16_02746 [Enterococcus faecium]